MYEMGLVSRMRLDGIKAYRGLPNVVGNHVIDIQRGMYVDGKDTCGVMLRGLKVLLFCKPGNMGRCIFLDKDSYWFPVAIEGGTAAQRYNPCPMTGKEEA